MSDNGLVPYIRIQDEWVKLTDLSDEQIAYLRELTTNAISHLDLDEMLARAWKAGHDAAEHAPWLTNPYKKD